MSTPSVTVYSTTWCGFCKTAKAYLSKIGVDFKEVNVEEDAVAAKYIVDKTQQRGVPVIQIGDDFIVGFDRPKIDAALSPTGPKQ